MRITTLSVQILFATILERLFFHSPPSILSVTGSVIILTSALYVAVSHRQSLGRASNAYGLCLLLVDGNEGECTRETSQQNYPTRPSRRGRDATRFIGRRG